MTQRYQKINQRWLIIVATWKEACNEWPFPPHSWASSTSYPTRPMWPSWITYAASHCPRGWHQSTWATCQKWYRYRITLGCNSWCHQYSPDPASVESFSVPFNAANSQVLMLTSSSYINDTNVNYCLVRSSSPTTLQVFRMKLLRWRTARLSWPHSTSPTPIPPLSSMFSQAATLHCCCSWLQGVLQTLPMPALASS